MPYTALFFISQLGYSSSEISALLIRIYKEQIDGNATVRRDLKERRERLKETLARLKNDEAEPEVIRQLAVSTLSELEGID